MKALFALIVTGLFAFQAFAQDDDSVEVGFVTPAGMTSLGNGLWRHPSGATYTRFRVSSPGRWLNGCYVAGSSYWQYRQVQVQQQVIQQRVVQQQTVTPPPKDWRNQIIDLYAAQLENQQFQEALNALGLNQPSYASQRLYPGYTMTGNVVNYGATGSSVYGYPAGVHSFFQQGAGIDIATLFQQAASLTQQAQVLGGRANEGFQGLVAKEGEYQARIADIQLRSQAAVAMLQALQVPSTTQSGFSFKLEPGGATVTPNVKVAPNGALERWGNIAAAKCAGCHYENNKKGGFDVSLFPSLPQPERQKVIARLLSNDPAKRMPRKGTPDASEPGEPLSQDEIMAWITCPVQQVQVK